MAKMTKKEMAEFIAREQGELGESIADGFIPPERARFATDAHNLTLADIAEEDGHVDLAQPLRRAIGD